MLNHLVDYAERSHLASEPGFAPKSVRWGIACDQHGGFTDIVSLGEGKQGRLFASAPHLTQGELVGGVAECHFLAESLDVVALYRRDESEPVPEKTQRKHEGFVELLEGASEAMPQLRPAALMLRDEQALASIRRRLRESGPPRPTPTDKATIILAGPPMSIPLERDGWWDWWRQYRADRLAALKPAAKPTRRRARQDQGAPAAGSAQMACLVTGELVTPTRTMEKIKGLAAVGGLSMGDALISFDKEAFTSYGLSQAQNAAMSEATAKTYVEALNALIREHGRRLANVLVTHWYKERVADPERDDPLAWLHQGQEDDAKDADEQQARNAQHRAREMLGAIRSGQRPDLAGNRFYALTLSGQAGRVMVRDWMEGAFKDLVDSVNAWFEDLEIVHRDGKREAPPPKFMAVAFGLVRDPRDLAAPHVAELWRVALDGRRPLGQNLLALALARVRADILNDDPPRHARMGLLRVYHARQERIAGGDIHMKPYLNEDHPDPAYHAGRLLAVLAALQRSALGDVGAGVVQRYYTAASQAPALVVGRLVANAKNHLGKLEPGLTWWYENEIAGILGRVKDRLPRTLNLEQQSLFALGYYQQLAHQRAGKDGAQLQSQQETQS